MNNIIKRKWNQNSMVIIEDLQGMAFQAESGGHTFQISGIDGEGNAVALSGTPAGVMLRADGQDVTLTCSVSGGVVYATLPANAYVVPGRFGLTIFLTSDGQKTAIYAAVGTVGKTSSGTVAPPAGSDVVTLVNAIAAAVATIPASYTDLMAAMAPTYSSSGLYAVGSYAWYSGKLYRCTTAITSGETWTSGHWTLANLGSDLVDLKSALTHTQGEVDGYYLDTGATSAEVSAQKNIKSVKVDGEIGSSWKIVTIYNTSSIQKRIIISNGTVQGTIEYNSSTGLNVGTILSGTVTVTIEYDWDSHGTNINNEYANSHLYLIGTSLTEKCKENTVNVSRIQDETISLNKTVLGFYVEKTGSDADFACANNIENVIIDGSLADGWKINIILNSGNYIKHIMINNGTSSVTLSYDANTGLNTGTISGGTVSIKYNWANHVSGINKVYAEAHICLIGSAIMNQINTNKNNIKLLFGKNTAIELKTDTAVNGAYARKNVKVTIATLSGYYLNDGGRLIGGQGSNLTVSYSSVTAGEVVNLFGEDVKLYGAYSLAVFSENLLSAGDLGDEVILLGSNTLDDYNKNYVCPKNGYVYTAYVTISGFGKIELYSTEAASSLIGEFDAKAFEWIASEEISSTAYNKKYIDTDFKIKAINNEVFYVDKFAVEANKTYIVKSDYFKLQAALPIAGFGTGDIDSDQTLLRIIGNETATTYTAYNVAYTAPANGYIYVAFADVSGSQRMKVYEADSVVKGLYELTNSSLLPLKVQVFGDSISDETWRTDQTTWVTLLSQYLTQRTLEITNNAVGGSGIGHGKSSGSRYTDLEFNFVYDLVTNDSIFKTDSDIIVMLVGTNDWAAGRYLGQWGDTTPSSFYGYARAITEYIATNTASLFIICTPIGRWNSADAERELNENGEPLNSSGKTLREFCDALVQTANYYEVPVLDLNRVLGWNRYNVRRFCSDGLHPTASGARWLSAIISNEIKFHIGA
ncbi:MAG: SGNH/GDSL hydrolase family protein [Clostridia bacterium]|nr:SGNH/GDSL hydrolase family protein [Clostridia bacterium]